MSIAEWGYASVVAFVVKAIYDEQFSVLKAPVRMLALSDCPASASKSFEETYYIHSEDIRRAVKIFLSNKGQQDKMETGKDG